MAIWVARYALAALVVALAVAATRTAAQTQGIPSCASKLVPCANFLNATKPPESCCGPLKDAVKNELPCLCSLFNSPDLLKAFNINLTQSLQLPKSCGIKSDQSICSKSAATPPSASSTTAASGGSGGSSSSDSTPPKKDSSEAFRGSVWIGNTVFVSMLAFGWSMMAL